MQLVKILCVACRNLGTALLLSMILLACSGKKNNKQNRLQYASSPYLKQHADNPVDWYEWGPEALDKARKENKPLIISIGYSSCHWCHEMKKESFMDTGVARIMNENFVCIKIDREERPDIDQVYMKALQLISGSAGWPLNAFALPDGKPFFAGTYFEKSKWISILNGVSKAYREKHALVVTQANALVNGMAEQDLSFLSGDNSAAVQSAEHDKAIIYDSIYKEADLVNGGLKSEQKFPTPAFAAYLLQHYYITGDKTALDLANTTLQKMAQGGIYDHVGGGFARYATDSIWRVPHFEKMLYDNGQLLSVYSQAYQLTKNEFYQQKVSEIYQFTQASLAAPGGAFYSSVNADTKDGEGVFYAWSLATFMNITGADPLLPSYYHLSEKGNWKPGLNLLYATETPVEFARRHSVDSAAFNSKLIRVNASLLQERNKRAKPVIDTKIITAWNGIMIKGLADAYAATGQEAYLLKARSCAEFVAANMMEPDGRLYRNYSNGKKLIDGFLDDYAWAITGLSRLYEVSFDVRWIELSKKIADYAIRNFYDATTKLFYYSKGGNGLVLRRTEVTDDAIPSSNAVMAKALYGLGKIYDDTAYQHKVQLMNQTVFNSAKKTPRYFIQWCILNELLNSKQYEVVIAGTDALGKRKTLQQHYLPTTVIMGSTGISSLPLLQNKTVNGKTMIYVCTDKMCKRPEESADLALKQLKTNSLTVK